MLAANINYYFLLGISLVATVFLTRKKWFLSIITILIAVLWGFIISPTLDLLVDIGSDSFYEANNFDWSEAGFFIETVLGNISFDISRKALAILIISVGIGIAICLFISKYIKRSIWQKIFLLITLSIGFVLIFIAGANKAKYAICAFMDNTNNFHTTANNFDNDSPKIELKNRNIKIVIYIADSTSVMNMQIYGYPRQTTPELEKLHHIDEGLLVFRNVFSTHTHTSPSLLEAFSLGLVDTEDMLPINERKRVSIVDIMSKAKVQSYLISNQGQTGTHNQASSIVFKNTERTFSTNNKHIGNREYTQSKPFDHIFFAEHLISKLNKSLSHGQKLIILHSYAGHGPYLHNIPVEFRNPVDINFAFENPEAIIGRKDGRINDIDDYDSTIKYIDFSVGRSIDMIKSLDDPTVFILFSDHGESVYSNRGHDSSRFIHEMARIPFLLYFNSAARREYPKLFKKYGTLSKTGSISTLAQLSSTLIDILGGDTKTIFPKSPSVIGSIQSTPIKPIMVRRTSKGITYVNLNRPFEEVDTSNSSLLDKTDDSTAIYAIRYHNTNNNTKVCYHRSNTLGKALRGSLVADCLEVDLVVQDDGTLSVYHPPLESVNLQLSHIINIANKKNLALWIDAKNLNSNFKCSILADFLGKANIEKKGSLIEFPSNTPLGDKGLLSCSLKLQALGFRTSFYVPTDKASICSKELDAGMHNSSDEDCRSLQEDLENAYQSKLFTDFSFDYSVAMAMENIAVAKKLRWNTWNVQAKDFEKIHPERFDMVIMPNNDPNNR